MFDFYCEGIRFGLAFLKTASHLPYEEIDEIVREAISMYIEEKSELEIEGPFYKDNLGYEGMIHTRGEIRILGDISGIHFWVELDTDKGRDDLEILVHEFPESLERQSVSRRLAYSKS